MAETSGANDSRPVPALTTPRRQTDPIGTARTSAARIEIQLRGPTRSPFVRHPVTTPVNIAARCSFEGEGTAPIERRAVFQNAATPSRLEIPLSREQAAGLTALEVWAEPYGHAALLDARGGKLALGRLRFERPLGGGQQNHAICEVHVLAGVAAFITGEMSKNVADSTVLACRRANESARIAPVWGERNRLGDSDKVYFHDIWSSIHFGYVGHAAGFTLAELLGGSDGQQRLDHGEDDESADKSAVREGYNLYDPTPGATLGVARLLGVVAAHDDWLLEQRQRQWNAAAGRR